MNFFYNQSLFNNFNEIYTELAISRATKYWGKEGVFVKSAIDLRILSRPPFGSISLLYGPRQVGKSSSLKLFLSQLKDSKTIIYTDCAILSDRKDLYNHLKDLIKGPTTIVLDEVQVITDWHLALRALYGEGKLDSCRVWCSGSEARHILESGERLPGRKGKGLDVFARPWSFREFVQIFFPDSAAKIPNIKPHHIQQSWLEDFNVDLSKPWAEYLICGGIPQVMAEFKNEGVISDETMRVYIDWILGTWSKVRTAERSLSALSLRFCETLNSRVGFDTLKKGTDIQSPNTVKTLIEMQEDHFSLTIVPRFDPQNEKFVNAKLKKIYPIDPFICQIFFAIGKNKKRQLTEYLSAECKLQLNECAFQAQFFRHFENKYPGYIYSDRTHAEVDFICDGIGYELKSKGRPSAKQVELLKECRQAFSLNEKTLPLMAFLVGEERFSS